MERDSTTAGSSGTVDLLSAALSQLQIDTSYADVPVEINLPNIPSDEYANFLAQALETSRDCTAENEAISHGTSKITTCTKRECNNWLTLSITYHAKGNYKK